MSTTTTTEAATVTTESEQIETPKPTETVEFWKQKAREQEKRAKENAAAATRLAEIEEAQKSEAERAAERLVAAETKATEAEAKALRREIALEHGLTTEDAALLDTITDEDAMRALAGRLAVKDVNPRPNHVPREGTNHQPADDQMREFTRNLFERARNS